MRMATMISLGASAALGLGALVVARVWLPSQTPRAQTTAAAAQPAPGIPVVVASGAITFGTRLEPRNLRIANLPASAAPSGHFSTIAQVINQEGGAPVALAQIAQNEPILPTRISGPGARPTLSAEIHEGMRAYTIGVSDVLGGGGHILPGDRVDIMLTRTIDPVEGDGGGRTIVASVVVQDVRVLGMDLNADPTSERPAVAHTATLEVTLQDSVRLALATQAGTLSLALRRNGSNEIVSQRPVVLVNGGGRRRPARDPDAAAAPRAPAAPARPAVNPNERSLVVSSGGTHTTITVPAGN